tara:strand:+ start:8461 stop:8682 length:222 start_codon:yes stop_codon:yes gene_type:complete
VTTRLTTLLASIAVRAHTPCWLTGLTYADYEYYGNNIAAGQFEQQVWAPVCHDPSAEAVAARASIDFDWTVRN